MINIQWCISFRMCGIGQKTSRRLYTTTARRKNRRSSWSGSTISKITYGIPAPHVEEMQIDSLRVWSQCHCTSATSTKDSMATSSTLDAKDSYESTLVVLRSLNAVGQLPCNNHRASETMYPDFGQIKTGVKFCGADPLWIGCIFYFK